MSVRLECEDGSSTVKEEYKEDAISMASEMSQMSFEPA